MSCCTAHTVLEPGCLTHTPGLLHAGPALRVQHAAAVCCARLLLQTALRPGPVLGCVAAGACSGDEKLAEVCRFTLHALAASCPNRLAVLAQAFSQAPAACCAAFAQVVPCCAMYYSSF